jgi:hypothetical protein
MACMLFPFLSRQLASLRSFSPKDVLGVFSPESILGGFPPICKIGGFPPKTSGILGGGVADEWVTQMLRQGDAQVFKKYSQMKLQMKREALEKLNRRENEMSAQKAGDQKCTVLVR